MPNELMTKSAKVAAKPCVGFVVPAAGAASSALRFCAAASSDDFSVFGGLAAADDVGQRRGEGWHRLVGSDLHAWHQDPGTAKDDDQCEVDDRVVDGDSDD